MTHFSESRYITSMNWALVASACLLFVIGIINLYSASGIRFEEGIAHSGFYRRQMIWGGMGVFFMLACLIFDYRRLHSFIPIFFAVSVFFLLLVPFFGKTVYGAKRWLDFGLFSFQPSEMAKFSVLLLGAKFLSSQKETLGWIQLFKTLSLGLVPAALIVMQPDLGTALSVMAVLGGMTIYHGIKAYVLKVCVVLIPLFLPFSWFLLRDYQKQRILTFLDPTNDPRGAGYHIIQSQIAIGSGEMWGKGFLQGTQSQLRFLPEKHTDFAIAVFGEEWGFIGCVLLLGLFCFFLLSIFVSARDARDSFGSTLAAGVFMYFFWQILVNIGMVVGLMPVVGIPLPFISYGGSATLVNFALIGLVLNVSIHKYTFKR